MRSTSPFVAMSSFRRADARPRPRHDDAFDITTFISDARMPDADRQAPGQAMPPRHTRFPALAT